MQQTVTSPYVYLSPRQIDVLTDAAAGLTAQQCGRRRGLGRETVKNYIWETRRKLGADTIAHAVFLWVTMEDAPAVDAPFKAARERWTLRQRSQPQEAATHPWRKSRILPRQSV